MHRLCNLLVATYFLGSFYHQDQYSFCQQICQGSGHCQDFLTKLANDSIDDSLEHSAKVLKLDADNIKDPPFSMSLPILFLAFLAIGLGIYPDPVLNLFGLVIKGF